jgi:peptidoglycan/LPS O-acetylase OafA/YrhL
MISNSRNFGLDLIRAFSILLVLVGHGFSHLLEGVSFYLFSFIDGVDIFFVLSGFLIGGIFLKDFNENTKFNLKSILFFLKRRWFRTLPAYYAAFLIISILGFIGFTNFSDFSIKGLFFVQNLYKPQPFFFSVSWSLSVEEWAYLIFPFSVYFFNFIFKN